jgi:DNA-binding LacI/PurR family transcriptional regulator
MAVTIVEIAKELNLSHTTVSRVLNGKAGGFVSDKTQEMVLNKANEMGYSPNYNARALVTGRTNVIAFIGGYDLPDAVYGWLIREARHTTAKQGYEIITGDLNAFLKIKIDGLIGLGIDNFDEIYKLNIPIVNIDIKNIPTMDDIRYDTVVIDSGEGYRAILNHVYDQGCRSIVFVHINPIKEWDTDPRVLMYKEIMKEKGLPERYIDVKHQTRDMVADEFYAYLQNHSLSDAYLCSNDNNALAVISALYKAGYNVPADTLVTGFDGMQETKCSIPPLTTLDIDYGLAIEEGISILIQRLSGENSECKQVKIIPANAYIRESAIKRRS